MSCRVVLSSSDKAGLLAHLLFRDVGLEMVGQIGKAYGCLVKSIRVIPHF